MPEQIKPGSSVRLALDEFETIDLSFHLSLTPFASEGGQDGRRGRPGAAGAPGDPDMQLRRRDGDAGQDRGQSG